MPSAVRLREDYSAEELRALARRSKNVNQSRRLLSLAAVRDGMDRGAAAKIGGMDRQTLRDWVHRFNAVGSGGPASTTGRRVPSLAFRRSNWLSSRRSSRRVRIVRRTASCAGGGSTSSASSPRGSASTFIRAMSESFCRSSASRTSAPGRVIRLRTSGSSRLSKKLPARAEGSSRRLPETTPVEIWFEDEARIGQKNGQVRQWARRGTRPRQPADQRYDNAYLFGAICPARGVGAALALPYADADMMQLHLDEISRNVAEGAHAVLLLDRAGWHTTGKLDVPDNITPIFLPSRAPELNPVENVWQYLRQNWLSNTVFENYDAIVDAACAAWRKLIAQPETITSIGMRDWAHVGQPL